MPVQFIVKPATKFAKLVKLFTSQSGVEKGKSTFFRSSIDTATHHTDAYQYRYDGNRMNPNGIPDISMQQCGFEVGKVYLIEAFNEQVCVIGCSNPGTKVVARWILGDLIRRKGRGGLVSNDFVTIRYDIHGQNGDGMNHDRRTSNQPAGLLRLVSVTTLGSRWITPLVRENKRFATRNTWISVQA